jgi:hypothetical protein
MGGRSGLRYVLGRPVLDEQHAARAEQPGRLGDDRRQIGNVVDQGALEDDVGARIRQAGGDGLPEPEPDTRESAVSMTSSVEDVRAEVHTSDGRGTELVPGAGVRPRIRRRPTSAALGSTSVSTTSRQDGSAARPE